MLPINPLAHEIGGAVEVSLHNAGMAQTANNTAARMDDRRIVLDFNVLGDIRGRANRT